MATEIERKFLIRRLPDLESVPGESMVQGYLRADAGGSVRVRISAAGAILNVKGPRRGLARPEFEYPIPEADAREMLATLGVGHTIEKVRYRIPHQGFTWEVDVFGGRNEGLVVAEVELEHAGVLPPLPDWVGAEVSDDHRYSNGYLSRHPFRDWPERPPAHPEG